MVLGKASLRKHYDVLKLSKEFVGAGDPAKSVNCDGALVNGFLFDHGAKRGSTGGVALIHC